MTHIWKKFISGEAIRVRLPYSVLTFFAPAPDAEEFYVVDTGVQAAFGSSSTCEQCAYEKSSLTDGGLSITSWNRDDQLLQVNNLLERRMSRGFLCGGMPSSSNQPNMTTEQIMRLHTNRKAALENKRMRRDHVDQDLRAPQPSQRPKLSQSQIVRIQVSRDAALERKRQKLSEESESSDMNKNALPPRSLHLALRNSHDRDNRIVFTESSHTYLLDGEHQFPISISGVWSKFFEPFNAERTIDQYFVRWSENPAHKYYGIIQSQRAIQRSDADIKTDLIISWKDVGLKASSVGTFIHRQIELYLNAESCEDHLEEMVQFKNFLVEFIIPRGWLPYRTEWSIFDEHKMIAGQLDSLWLEPSTNAFHMIDWKIIEKPMDGNEGYHFRRFGFYPCHELLDNKFNHYMCQQNLYALLLKDHYGIMLTSMWLVQLHRNRSEYTAIPVPKNLHMARLMMDMSASLPHQSNDSLCGVDYEEYEDVKVELCCMPDILHNLWPISQIQHGLRHMCFIKACHNLCIPVECNASGPYWIVQDGNLMLRPLGFCILPVHKEVLSSSGLFIIAKDKHCYALLSVNSSSVKIDGNGHPEIVDQQGMSCLRIDDDVKVYIIKHLHAEPLLHRWCDDSLCGTASDDEETVPDETEPVLLEVKEEKENEEVDDANADLIKHLQGRQQFPGASTSDASFDKLFAKTKDSIAKMQASTPRIPTVPHEGIMHRSRVVMKFIKDKKPNWNSDLQRLVCAAIVMYRFRLTDIATTELVQLVWLILGNWRLRSHDGCLYFFNKQTRVWTFFRGMLPESIFSDIRDFMNKLEGLPHDLVHLFCQYAFTFLY